MKLLYLTVILEKKRLPMEDTRTRIIAAAIKAVRQYGLEGARIQNISELAELSPGALYRYFDSKEQLMLECFQPLEDACRPDGSDKNSVATLFSLLDRPAG